MTATPDGLRVSEIDGLRGWAALCVVVFHELQQTMGFLHPQIPGARWWLFVDGPMAVYVFFILSGDSLSTAFVTTGQLRGLQRMMAKRYFRLSVPIFLSVTATLIVMRLGLVRNQQAAVIVHGQSWLGTFLMFRASMGDVVHYAMLGVFGWADAPLNFNSFLWTMPVEMVGSFLLFCYLPLVPRLRWPMAVTFGLMAGFAWLTMYFGFFFFGILLAQLRAAGLFAWLRKSLFSRFAGAAVIACAYGYEYWRHAYPAPNPLRTDALAVAENFLFLHALAIIAILVVCGVYMSLDAVWFFRTRISRILGQLSFGIYLFQLPIICSLESILIIRYAGHLDNLRWVLGIAAVSIAATAAVAAFFRMIELMILDKIDFLIRLLFDTPTAPPLRPQRPGQTGAAPSMQSTAPVIGSVVRKV